MAEPAVRPSPTTILYTTMSICPRCTLLDRAGVNPILSVVEEKADAIYIRVPCSTHGPQHSLYCSDAAFFRRWMKESTSHSKRLADIEDLTKNLGLESRSQTLPLSFDLALFKNDSFLSDEEIAAHISRIRQIYPDKRQFVMRLSGRLAPDIEVLNQKILLVHSLLKQGEPILVSVSFERLVLLADLEQSCFLKPRIYPAMKYYLRRDDEALCLDEMTQLVRVLQEFQGIKAVFSISLETPWPDMGAILQFLRSHKGLIKLVEFQLERSPRRMIDAANKAVVQENRHTDLLDPIHALKMIADSTNGEIALDDFYPVSKGRVFEPFLAMAGMGKFSIRPSPFCGFGTVLCSSPTDDPALQSVPLSRFVDIDKFCQGMAPLLPKIEADGSIGWWTGRSIKKVLSQSAKQKLPDVFAYLTDRDKAPLLAKFVENLQFIVVHNHMDVALADLQRRCDCASLNVDDGTTLVAACLGCV